MFDTIFMVVVRQFVESPSMALRGARSTGGKHSRAYEGPEGEGFAPPLVRVLARRLLMVSHVRGLFSLAI